MNKVDKIRKELSQKVLCCFTCYHGVGGACGKFVCDREETALVAVSRNSLCEYWHPDVPASSQADWDNLMDARANLMEEHNSPNE